MNKVYKLVWSKTKNMYVAVCEYARTYTKSPTTGGISRAVVAGVLLLLLSGGIATPVWADAVNITSSDNENPNTVTDDSTIVVGKDNNLTGGEHVVVGTGNDFSSISRTPYDIVAFGNSNSFAYSDSPYVTGTIVVGNGNQVAEGSVSIGYNVNNSPGNDYFSGTPGSFTVAIGYDSTAEGERSVSLGNSSYTGGEKSVAVGNAAYAIGKGSVAVGNFSQTNNDDSIAIGNNSVTDYSDSVAIGSSATTKDYESIAVGSSATTTSSNSVSLGYSATTNSSYSIALGHSSVVDGYAGTALGYEANVSGENSVALGSYSVANEDFTVSVGDSTYDMTRRITNVSDGVADTDAATVKQLKNYDNQKVLAGNNIHVVESTDANGVKQFTVSAVVDSSNLDIHGDGIIEDNNVGLLSGETVYHEVHVNSDGNYIQSANTTAQNLMALDTAVGNIDSTIADYNLVAKYDSATKDVITFSGTSGTKLTNLIPAVLSDTSTDAVVGSQLYSTNQNLSSEITNRTSADNALSNRIGALTLNGHYILKGNSLAQNLAILDSQIYAGSGSPSSSGTVNTNHFIGFKSSDASDPNYDGLGATGDGSISIGFNTVASSVNSIAIGKDILAGGGYHDETRNVAIGTDITADNNDIYAGSLSVGNHLQNHGGIVLGLKSAATINALAVGEETKAYDFNSTAIGYKSTARGSESVSMGVATETNGTYNVALGSYARASGSYSLAIGQSTYAYTKGSSNPYEISQHGNVAIGKFSSTGKKDEMPDDLVFSIGCDAGDTSNDEGGTRSLSITRRIIHVTDGKSPHDAATVGQTIELSNGLNSVAEVQEDANAIGQKVVKINVSTNGQVASGNTGIVSGDTVYNAIQDALQNVGGSVDVTNKANIDAENVTDAQAWADKLGIGTVSTEDTKLITGAAVANETRLATDGNYVLSDKTAGENISILDTSLKALDTIAVKYDGEDLATATLAGTSGTKLTNLKPATLSASSTDAVIGAQLYAVKQDITGFASDIRANASNIDVLNSSVTAALSSVSASGLLVDTLDSSKADKSLSNLSDAGKRVLKTYAEDAVATYLAEQGLSMPAAPMAVNTTNSNTLTVTNAGNGSLHVGEGSYVNGTSSIAIGVGNQVNANNSGAFGDPSIINADESYVLGNDDTINTGATGSFIVGNDGISDAKGGLLFGSNTKATVEAENGMALGNNAEVSAKNAIALGSGSIADVDNTLSIGNSELKRKIINVADGDISQNSSEVVTGAQLFVTNEKVQQNTEAIAKKADIDGGNINTSDWATKLGIGKVEDGNADLVTGGTVYDAIKGIGDNQLVQSNGDAITIGANSTATVIDVSDVNGQGRTITGIVTDVNDASSVANVGYVNQVGENIINATNSALQRVDNKINKAGANAAAIANLPTPTFDGDEKWAFAVGIGRYQGETAGAVGAFYKPTDNVIARVSGSFGNGDEMVGAGVAVSLNKANTPVVSKAQLVRTINAQANRIQQVEQENASIRAENADMKQMMFEMRQELDALKTGK